MRDTDKYKTWKLMATKHPKEFKIIRGPIIETSTCVIAPHGGAIEPGTSELAEDAAGNNYSWLVFEGNRKSGNKDLHITSTKSQGKEIDRFVKTHPHCLALHGAKDRGFLPGEFTIIGGRDTQAARVFAKLLAEKDFCVILPAPSDERWDALSRPQQSKLRDLEGRDPKNICNKCSSTAGVQFEISASQRSVFFAKGLKKRNHRNEKTDRFREYVGAIQEALLHLNATAWAT